MMLAQEASDCPGKDVGFYIEVGRGHEKTDSAIEEGSGYRGRAGRGDT